MGAFSFDASKVAPDEGRVGALPTGWYPVAIDKSEVMETKDGQGERLMTRYDVLDGPYKGSKIWHYFNTKNNSDKAVEIALKQLSALMHAINVLKIDVTEQLHNKPLFVKIKQVAADGQYEAKNEITAFRPANDAAAIASYKEQLAGKSAAPVQKAPPAQAAPRPVQAAPGAPAGGWGGGQPANAPVQQAPAQQAAPAQTQTATQAPAPSWNGGAQQPWNNGAQADPNVQAAATTATAAATSTASPTSAPASAPAVQQQQANWNAGANGTVVQKTSTAASSQEVQTASSVQGNTSPSISDDELPPWMQ